MTPVENVIAAYEKLLAHSTRRLASAREGQWAQLAQQEADYLAEVESLKALEARYQHDIVGNTAGVRRKAALIERILKQDRQIQQLAASLRDELRDLMDDSRHRRDLSKLYSAGAGIPSDNQGLR
nr:flagellar protein FliT [uncultured Halomonas sp.]